MEDWDPFADPAEAPSALAEYSPPPISSEGRALATPVRNSSSSFLAWDPCADPEDVLAQKAKDAAEKRRLEQQALRQGMQVAIAAHSAKAASRTVSTPAVAPAVTESSRTCCEVNETRNPRYIADGQSSSSSARSSVGRGVIRRADCGYGNLSSPATPSASSRLGRFSALAQSSTAASSLTATKRCTSTSSKPLAASSARLDRENTAEDSDAELEAAAASGNVERLQQLLSRRALKLAEDRGSREGLQKQEDERVQSQSLPVHESLEAPIRPEVTKVLKNESHEDPYEVPRLADLLDDIDRHESEEAEYQRSRDDFSALSRVQGEESECRLEGSQRALAQIIKAQADPSLDAKELLGYKPGAPREEEHPCRKLVSKPMRDDPSSHPRRKPREFRIFNLNV
mmetsp:Transcript_126840/g.201092  ORF Transcript_126840/g.201092 Transcript_126840/m.201092 type:complete len:400 (-) Transcript_126840:87-1286(-)